MKIREAVIRAGDRLVNVGDLTGLSLSDKINAMNHLNHKYMHVRPVVFLDEGIYLPHPTIQNFEAPIPDNDLFIEYEI